MVSVSLLLAPHAHYMARVCGHKKGMQTHCTHVIVQHPNPKSNALSTSLEHWVQGVVPIRPPLYERDLPPMSGHRIWLAVSIPGHLRDVYPIKFLTTKHGKPFVYGSCGVHGGHWRF